MGTILDGAGLAKKIKGELHEKVKKLNKKPGLVVLLLGENPASKVYVKHKEMDAEEIGFLSKIERLPVTTTEEELLDCIERYNQNDDYHGILVQLPLPEHINEEKVLLAIRPEKDVDGFHPMNIGRLVSGNPLMTPCTPYGIMELLEEYKIELSGKTAVVIGRSNIVGKPIATLLTAKNATVTIAHSKTKNLAEVAKSADILVVAIGVAEMVDKSFVKKGAVVIDVGMNRNAEGKLVGDVKFDEVAPLASFITPVPRGVGPMTRAMLMKQTLEAFERTL
ncbi:methylenetetrahydrofolate dehydrogenase (NADP+) / methenyltetrahydrofolate cyclohydrolase [Pilibacter termitis]|uniref:Bifunctional protein FolD n=1 Tax=Pilibacter termitis TaxID=263852 RepID=A0A1T4NRS1_9ENTE|nr:bifunctional methylenetetrahydrofolate dehydrogenase/methenyltetrahydrofolate cyclohydrolase [Pilibacter termitis]SJZ81963.1 methylenetetrahydrofolate dehydrogenase (NADP+) / methenyltetrahydrofolate cyclohydrolase [Pilibacter termitis]